VTGWMMQAKRTWTVEFEIFQHLDHAVPAGECHERLTVFRVATGFSHLQVDSFEVVLDCETCRGEDRYQRVPIILFFTHQVPDMNPHPSESCSS
jgi:hypothetical protein